MIEPPEIEERQLNARVRDAFGLFVTSLTFLPVGNAASTWVYRVETMQSACFLKVRRGGIDEATLLVPRLLHDRDIREVVAPERTQDGGIATTLGDFTLALYPYIDGVDGMTMGLSAAQWTKLGRTLRRIHETPPPEHLARETFAPWWRDLLATLSDRAETTDHALARHWQARRTEIATLAQRTEALRSRVQGRPHPLVLCHTDLHPGNVRLSPDGGIHIVDWDAPRLAPPERDLVFFEGEEREAFLRGYGDVAIDPVRREYFRHERVLTDLCDYATRVFSSSDGGEATKEQAVDGFVQMLAPGEDVASVLESPLP